MEQTIKSQVSIGEKFFKLRDYTPIPLILLLLFMADTTILTATVGTLSIVFGELIRIYSVGFIGTVSRTRSSSTGGKVISDGPFAWVRNPLYVGNYFITMGFAIYGGVFWIILLSGALFAIQYHFIVRYEESHLENRFGDDYRHFKARVPRWVPVRLPGLSEINWEADYGHALKSEKRTLTAIFVLLLLLVWVA